MLCRTANELFWMSRHIERAENAARLLDVTYRMSLLPYEVVEPGLAWAEPWAVPLVTSGMATSYYERFEALAAENVLRLMILDPANPSSIYSCLRAARESARSVRGAITSEMYEDLNSAWLEMCDIDYATLEARGVSEFLDWVKMRSHLFRGVTFGTMLRDEAYHFLRLGTHLERADNTARILDVKYHTLLPSAADVGGAVDYYQWGALLRSVSGFESYRKIYSDVITPRRVAELLILREDMPRSLHASMNFIFESLERLCDNSSREVERAAGELHAKLHYGRADDIIEQGLHEYLMDFLERISALGEGISRHFLAPAY
ncbi:MAG: alpha-E domain-containing protein [Casimicrobiaceae bacterium]